MLLNVQQAAARLGVSPVTIRRWTTSGFLPCTRTAGGHRRIDKDEIDEIAKAIGGSNHLAARLARERELETLVSTAIALSSQLDLTELLAEIAKQMTSLLDCHFCAISEYDPVKRTVRMLAEHDYSGQRLADTAVYLVRSFPVTRKVLEEGTIELVNVDDPAADPAEAAVLRRDGDKSLLMAPLVYQNEIIGLIELVDQKRARKYSRQELRLCGAIAGQAAVALHNAALFADQSRSDRDVGELRAALTQLSLGIPAVAAAQTRRELLTAIAENACAAVSAISCVVRSGEISAGAFGRVEQSSLEPGEDTTARVITVADPAGEGITIAATLPYEVTHGKSEILELLAAIAATLVKRLAEDG